MSRRRILLVSHYALPHLGGMETVIDAAARELVRRGHEVVHVASSAHSGAGAAPAAAPPYEVIRVPAANWPESRLGVPYPLFSPSLLGVLRRRVAAADIVHAHGFLYMSSVLALVLAHREGRAARVLTEHVGHVDYDVRVLDRAQAAAIATVGRVSVRRAQALVAINPKVAGELRGLAPGRPVEVIGNGVDAEAFRPPATGERARLRAALGWDERPRVLFVGRLVAKKGVDAALDAAAALPGAFELVLVGPGRIARPLPPGVTALGSRPPAEVAELMRAADVFLLPSRGEGFPVTAQEAMASGLPVVLGDDPAYAPHLDGSGAAVRLVRPEGPAVAAALAELVADPAARELAGRDAARHARRAFSWAAATDALEALYDRVASMATPKPGQPSSVDRL